MNFSYVMYTVTWHMIGVDTYTDPINQTGKFNACRIQDTVKW